MRPAAFFDEVGAGGGGGSGGGAVRRSEMRLGRRT